MTIKAGNETTEHKRALRAEAAAGALLSAGLVLAVLGSLHEALVAAVGVLLVAVGAALLASVNRAYMGSRGEVKAAAVRRPVDQAPVKVI